MNFIIALCVLLVQRSPDRVSTYIRNAAKGNVDLQKFTGGLFIKEFEAIMGAKALLKVGGAAGLAALMSQAVNGTEKPEMDSAISELGEALKTSGSSLIAKVQDNVNDKLMLRPTQHSGNAKANKLGNAIASGTSLTKSIGRCALYVRRALQKAGFPVRPQASAYMYHTRGELKRLGFKMIGTSSDTNYKPIKGDIAVCNAIKGHPHGHICVYDGDRWVSDFKQRRMSVYGGRRVEFFIYRWA